MGVEEGKEEHTFRLLQPNSAYYQGYCVNRRHGEFKWFVFFVFRYDKNVVFIVSWLYSFDKCTLSCVYYIYLISLKEQVGHRHVLTGNDVA